MARPRQFDEVEVKSALSNVFWKHGYEGTSYSDIMAATGLNKGSLYSSFGDKRALYKHALAEYRRTEVEPLLAILRNRNISPKERIGTLMERSVAAAQTQKGRRGCLMGNAAVGQSPFNEDVEAIVAEALSALRKAIKFCVKGTVAENKTDLIWTAYVGSQVMVKAGYSKARLREHRKQALSLFD